MKFLIKDMKQVFDCVHHIHHIHQPIQPRFPSLNSPQLDMSNFHFSSMSPGQGNSSALMSAMTDGISLSNRAVAASNAGQHMEACKLHQKALDLKIAAYGSESV